MSVRTVADLISRVRQVLQDEDAGNYRYPTSSIVGYYNDSILVARRLRPDLFIGRFGLAAPQAPSDPATNYSTVPFMLPDDYFPPTCDYVAGRSELRDDEFAVDGRAMTFVSSFSQALMGGA